MLQSASNAPVAWPPHERTAWSHCSGRAAADEGPGAAEGAGGVHRGGAGDGRPPYPRPHAHALRLLQCRSAAEATSCRKCFLVGSSSIVLALATCSVYCHGHCVPLRPRPVACLLLRSRIRSNVRPNNRPNILQRGPRRLADERPRRRAAAVAARRLHHDVRRRRDRHYPRRPAQPHGRRARDHVPPPPPLPPPPPPPSRAPHSAGQMHHSQSTQSRRRACVEYFDGNRATRHHPPE
jgi:hypothetical protein